MSDLLDIRGKVDRYIYAVIQGEMAAQHCTESEAIRRLLEPVARQRIHAAKVANSHLRGEGYAGTAGDDP